MPNFFRTILDFFKSIRGGFLKIFSSRADAANNHQPDHNDDNNDFKIRSSDNHQNCSEILLDLDSEIKKLTTKNDELNEFIQSVRSLQEPSSTKRDKIDEKLTDTTIKRYQTPQLIFNDFQSDDCQEKFEKVQQCQTNIQNKIEDLKNLKQHYFNTHLEQENFLQKLDVKRCQIEQNMQIISEDLLRVTNKPSNEPAVTNALIQIKPITNKVKIWHKLCKI